MSTLNCAVYAEGCMYPSVEANNRSAQFPPVPTIIADLQQSGFETVILSLFHIGRNYQIQPIQNMGDIYYNDTLIISQGQYVGEPSWPQMINGMIGGSVLKVCASIGGGEPVMDFQTIWKIYTDNGGLFAGTNLEACLQTLRQVFPAIGIIDMDCEDYYDAGSFQAFCALVIGMGFGVTFCPYANQPFWVEALFALQGPYPGRVLWWNLQEYGGAGDPAGWASAISGAIPGFQTNDFLIPGETTDGGPGIVEVALSAYKGEPSVGGAFLWTLDQIIQSYSSNPLQGMQDFVAAIEQALGTG